MWVHPHTSVGASVMFVEYHSADWLWSGAVALVEVVAGVLVPQRLVSLMYVAPLRVCFETISVSCAWTFPTLQQGEAVSVGLAWYLFETSFLAGLTARG